MNEMQEKLLFYTTIIYIVTILIGLYTGITLHQFDVQFTEDASDPMNSLGLIAYILVMTGVLLLLIKARRGFFLIRGLMMMAFFFATLIVLDAISVNITFIDPLALSVIEIVVALALTVGSVKYPNNTLLRNSFATIASAGVGAIIGVSLETIPLLLFIIGLGVYDYIAVFKTKHMITLAKGMTKKNVIATFNIPTKKRVFQLGTGDLVIPTATAVSTWVFIHPLASVLVTLGALAGLLTTIVFTSSKAGKAMPALPLQVVGILIALGIYSLTLMIPA
ncbi:MAG: hypothetical protein GOV15_01990 [Candidatus Diapherotrites archaeon]|nr:hypothetical protein [Candidatus Diapherotrites archaeon]